jgi:hypothetical protein
MKHAIAFVRQHRQRSRAAVIGGAQQVWLDALAPSYAALYGRPAIGFVVVGRSDLYGGSFGRRLAATLEWNLAGSGGDAIYVEWNPPPDRPLDAHWLTDRFPRLRAYVVSPGWHERLSTNPHIPAMEFIAKNVGIRRATNPWIAVINADVALGADFIAHLPLIRDKATVYGGHPIIVTWKGETVTRAFLEDSARQVSHSLAHPSLIGFCGNLLIAHRELWHRIRGYDETVTDRRVNCDDHAMAQMQALGVRARILGHRYEFDDPGSWKYGPKPHHGEPWDFRTGVPYRNRDDWGLANARELQIGERVWSIE